MTKRGEVRFSIVYTIRRDRQVYVGCTYEDTLGQRLVNHRHTPSNRRLLQLLTDGLDYEVSQESRHRTRELAVRAETRLIAALKRQGLDVLNRFTPGKEGAELSRLRAKERAAGNGWVRCCLCQQRHPRDYYYSDVSRSSGLASRCNACMYFIAMMSNRLKEHNPSVAYYAARGCIEAWRDGRYQGPHPTFQRRSD